MAPRTQPAVARAAEGPEARGAGVGQLRLPALPRALPSLELKAPRLGEEAAQAYPRSGDPAGRGGLRWAVPPPPPAAHLQPARTAAPGRPSRGRLVTPASA